MSFPTYELVSNPTVYFAACAVYLPSDLFFKLYEVGTTTVGTGSVNSSSPGPAYTKTTFASTLQTALTAASPSSFTYTVTSLASSYLTVPPPSGDGSVQGSPWRITCSAGDDAFRVTFNT